MKSSVIFLIVVGAIGAALFFYQRSTQQEAVQEQVESGAQQGKLMSIESYVTQNISLLSPEKEVLGGTFYVTKIEVEPEEKKGYVEYEDGHVAFAADFTYTADDVEGITITSFVIRD